MPSLGLHGGYITFTVSILTIGLITAVIGDVASHLGCFIFLKDTVNAIAFVALGTSVPGKSRPDQWSQGCHFLLCFLVFWLRDYHKRNLSIQINSIFRSGKNLPNNARSWPVYSSPLVLIFNLMIFRCRIYFICIKNISDIRSRINLYFVNSRCFFSLLCNNGLAI